MTTTESGFENLWKVRQSSEMDGSSTGVGVGWGMGSSTGSQATANERKTSSKAALSTEKGRFMEQIYKKDEAVHRETASS
jgi:hypothetical protein